MGLQAVRDNFGRKQRVGRGHKDKYFEHRNPCPETHPRSGRALRSLRLRGRQTMRHRSTTCRMATMRHVQDPATVLESPSTCWSPMCHVGLQARGHHVGVLVVRLGTPDMHAFPLCRHMVCLPVRRKLRTAPLPIGCISGHAFLCSKSLPLGPGSSTYRLLFAVNKLYNMSAKQMNASASASDRSISCG